MYKIVQFGNIAYIFTAESVMPSDHVLYTGTMAECEFAWARCQYDLERYGRVLGLDEVVS